jgi:hypothetical protein
MGWVAEPSSKAATGASELQAQKPSIPAILTRIQTHVGTKRIRVQEFFKDFDRLRSYSIPRQEFIRGVDNIECPLTPEEFCALADYYQDPNRKGCCKWKEFETEIEKGTGF